MSIVEFFNNWNSMEFLFPFFPSSIEIITKYLKHSMTPVLWFMQTKEKSISVVVKVQTNCPWNIASKMLTFIHVSNHGNKRLKEKVRCGSSLAENVDRWIRNSWWRHQMGTFSALLDLCAGISPVIGEFPAQRPVTQSFDAIFDLCLNKRLSKQSWGWWFETLPCSLWRHCNGFGIYPPPHTAATKLSSRYLYA